MNKETAQRLMNRVLDGEATASECKLLAAALRADPLLRQEFEELQLAHRATEGLFHRLALPRDFSKRIMREIQESHIPSDAKLRIPEFRPREVRRLRLARARRNRTRLFGVFAGVSAAAAVLLAAGVFTGFFARNGIGQDDPHGAPDDFLADGREGVPHMGEFDRTDSPTRQPIPDRGDPGDAEASQSEARREPTDPVPAPEPPREEPGKQIEKPEPDEPVEPEPPVEPDTSADEPVIEDDTAPPEKPDPQPEEPEGAAVSKPSKDGEKTEARESKPAEKMRIGSLTVLSGRVEMQSQGGPWVRADDSLELREGVSLKTSAAGVVQLSLDNGFITLGKRSEAKLENAGLMGLIEGSAGLDRDPDAAGKSLNIRIDDYDLELKHGAAVVERKIRGFRVTKAIGVVSVRHGTLGVMRFDEDEAAAAEVRFGEEFEEPQTGAVELPSWSADSRALQVMQSIDADLAARDFSNAERAYVDRNLPRGLERIMQYAVTCESVEEFLKAAIGLEKVDARGLKKMLDELESAFLDVAEHKPEQIAVYAKLACRISDDFTSWRDYFYRLMRPSVNPKPPYGKKPKGDYPEGDYPGDNKAKRVDKPRRHRPPREPEAGKEPDAE